MHVMPWMARKSFTCLQTKLMEKKEKKKLVIFPSRLELCVLLVSAFIEACKTFDNHNNLLPTATA